MIRILATSGIDITNPEILSELMIDLKRMDKMKHERMPAGSNAYRVRVTPSIRTFGPGLHRFRFEIQYGNFVEGVLQPKGEPVLYQTETLPFLG